MNESEMKFHLDAINKKDDEIYLLNTECEGLQERIGELNRENEQLVVLSEEVQSKLNGKIATQQTLILLYEGTIEKLQADIDASNRMDR